jgi:hypothetical protein
MRNRRGFAQKPIRLRSLGCAVLVGTCFLAPSIRAQDTSATKQRGSSSVKENKEEVIASQAGKIETLWGKDFEKYPGLQDELAKLVVKLRDGIRVPKPRTESRLLVLLPETTVGYAALPNYGSTAEQALKILRQELQESTVLRDWWEHGEMTRNGEKLLGEVEKFTQIEEYLGDEVVLSAAMEGKEGRFLFVAETTKPGLKGFLDQIIAEDSAKSFQGIRVIGPEDLATVKEKTPHDLLILVRDDYVVGALDAATLEKFDAQLQTKSQAFPGTAFGKRVAQEYTGGVTMLTAGDLHTILQQVSPELKRSETFQQSGFADMQYLVWDRKNVSGKPLSQMELSFVGPRQGAAAWIGKPTTLGSLEFVSPEAMFVGTLVLANPRQVFEGAEQLALTAHSRMFEALPGFEHVLGLSLKDDLLEQLGGELTLEISTVPTAKPTWRTLLAVKDAGRLQQTLNKLITATHVQSNQTEENGVTYFTALIPGQKGTTEIGYAFVNGYLLIGSSKEAVAEGVRLRQSGEGLGKSPALLAAAPATPGFEASGFLYENPMLMARLQMQRIAPGLEQSLGAASQRSEPLAMWLYGEDSAIREVSASPSIDAAGVLVVAAIAIPNLLRSRIAADEASAVGSVRTINTAQITYAVTYPTKGFAKNLSVVGPDPRGVSFSSPEHAAMVDAILACPGEGWCTKSGYRFGLVASLCKTGPCKEYAVTATPVSTGTGTRNFCSTSDGIIRYKMGAPLSTPLSTTECKTWNVLQ